MRRAALALACAVAFAVAPAARADGDRIDSPDALKALEALSGKGRPAPRLPRREEPLHGVRIRFQPQYQRARGAA